MGHVKLVLKNLNDKKVKLMDYVIEDGKESLLGRRNGQVLGIINIDLRRDQPNRTLNQDHDV